MLDHIISKLTCQNPATFLTREAQTPWWPKNSISAAWNYITYTESDVFSGLLQLSTSYVHSMYAHIHI